MVVLCFVVSHVSFAVFISKFSVNVISTYRVTNLSNFLRSS